MLSATTKQASVYYIDACFLLTLSQPKDNRHLSVKEFIKDSGENNVTFAISNHVYTEVYNNIFKFIVKRALSTYLKYQQRIHKANGKTRFIPTNEMDHLIDLEAVQFINREARQNLSYYNNNPENIFVPDLMKVAKEKPLRSHLLDCFYQKAKDIYDGLILILQMQGVNVLHLSSTSSDFNVAINYQLNYQLDSTDALHLAIAVNNNCAKFITLDGDFNHPSLVSNLTTIIIDKIA
nr:PIN domain-containing protein [Bacillus sp. RO1]